MAILTYTCRGCSRRTEKKDHCVYPSNAAFNALNPIKRDPLIEAPLQSFRRDRADAIKERNSHNLRSGGKSRAWWEGSPRMVKVGTSDKGFDMFAMMSVRVATKNG